MTMGINKRILPILASLFFLIGISTYSYSALEQVETVSDGEIWYASIWNDEFANFYLNPNDYCEGFSITSGWIGVMTGNLVGDVTGDIIDCIITTTSQPTTFTNIKYLPAWTAIGASDSPYSVSNGKNLLIDTTDGAITLTLPSTPSAGDCFRFVDITNSFATYNLTIDPNGNKLVTKTDSLVLDTECSFMFMYDTVNSGDEAEWFPVNFGYDNDKVYDWEAR